MDFSSYLQKKLSIDMMKTNSFGSLTMNAEQMQNLSLFSSASMEDIENIDFEQLLQAENATDVVAEDATGDVKALNEMVKALMELEDVQAAADVDGDGEISEAEAKEFIKSIMGNDGDLENLTTEDIDKAVEKLGIDLEELADKAIEEALGEEAVDEAEEVKEAKEAQQAQQAQQSGGSSGGGGSNGVSGNRNAGSQAPKVNDINNMSLEQLEAEKATREATLQEKQDAVNAVHNGDNANVKAAQDEMDKAKEAYDEALKNDENVPDELKTRQETNSTAIENNQKSIDDKEVEINNKETEISTQENKVSSLESNLSSLESSLSSLPSPTGKEEDAESDAQIAEKKASIEQQIADKKEEVETAKKELATKESELNKLNEEKGKLEVEKGQLEQTKQQIEAEIKKTCSEETKVAMDAYNEAKANVEAVKAEELSVANSELETAKSSVKEISDKITEVQNKETAKENSVNKFDFDFDENLTDRQKAEIELFEQNFEENRDKYEEVAERTGVPAELIAAIHWRESSGNFETYLHNGDPLGQPTTHVPAGLNYDNWTDAAVDAMSRYIDQDRLDVNDINTYYDVAERYNGLGYRNKGVESPYVWAGTDNYNGGKYVADGVYDPNHYDQQLGVALMLKRLMS